ncbi:hypothetical protein SEA_YECEY3_78 [Mycobacterium phage Yecey3]|uniref:Uncharacterized protein n=1 Tax=Mycobacterium phage Yecey3 TaxID=2656617 RepID=A0A649V9K4_9CAUD|nr:hypothetical protein KIV58_gp031 [Mycobacterium phage Yecey3]QGJ88829.1 hypothetical protein SEA_YECEY3_78 [Mycobacterium phage Yecey3]
MPLTKLGRLFPDLAHSKPEVVANVPGLLFVQKCEVWFNQKPEDPSTVVLIYKSTALKDTKPVYRETAEMILAAETQDVLYDEEIPDHSMIHGAGHCLLLRLAATSHERGYDRAVVTEIINGIAGIKNETEGVA